MSFLSDHADPGLELGPEDIDGWDSQRWQEDEQLRATRHAQVLAVAASMPRRLGQDATRAELARDKKLARRLEWAMRNAVKDWQGNPDLIQDAVSPDAQAEGARLDLETWAADRLAYIMERKHYVATVCSRRGEIKLGSQFVQRYINEVNHIKWATR